MILRMPEPQRDSESQGSDSLCRSILIVEDTRAISFLLSQYLRGQAERVDVAHDGHEAVRFVVRAMQSDQPYDLILMDLQMPIMSGLEATLAIRNRGIQTPIVAMTAGNLDPQRCVDAGCDGYVLKPIDRLTFLRYLRTVLDR